ncbi:prepilin-type N-terminal cleavage/methylation domain-containing protein [Paenibacillus sp. WLX1005]|uniref:prepilin-type N-terminal cleavage/methylation domain-containing protein n=1 Tax=unclassified Paenibacillus TaxID=185978 RepID=UPI00398434C1
MRQFVDRLRSQDGFSLVEVLAALIITGIMAGVIYGVALFGFRSYYQINTDNLLRSNGDILTTSIITQLYSFAPERVRQITSGGNPVGIRLERTSQASTAQSGDMEMSDIYVYGGVLYIGNVQQVAAVNKALLSTNLDLPATSTQGALLHDANRDGIDDLAKAVSLQGRILLNNSSTIAIQSPDGSTFYTTGIINVLLKLSSDNQGQSNGISLQSSFGF